MANVTGPVSSTDKAIARWNGTSGTIIQDSVVTVDDSGNINGVTALQGDDSTTLATTDFVQNAFNNYLNAYYPGYAVTVSTLGLVILNATYSNGSSGVGATLTNAGTMAALSIDGINMAVNDTVLVGGQTDTTQNGIYTVTTVGSGAVNWVLTRATVYDTPSQMNDNGWILAQLGIQNIAQASQQTAVITTIGTDGLVFNESVINGFGFMDFMLPSGNIYVGDVNGVAQQVVMSGDVTISNTGVMTIKSSVALAGSPTTTTQTAADNSTKIATTAYVDAAVSAGAGASPVVGSTRNAKMSVTTAGATATFTADQIIVETALNGTALMLSSYSQSINLGTTGAGGMDTGSAPNNGWISLYAIAKADGTKNILACNETTSNAEIYGGANMPSGYTYSALIGVWRTNGSGQFTTGYLIGRTFWHGASVNVLNNAGGASPTTYTSITLTSAVPAKANGLFGTIGSKDNNYSNWQLSATSGGLIQRAYVPGEVGSGQTVDGFLDLGIPFDFPLPTSQTMYYKMAVAANTSRMNINGYTF